MEIISLRMRNDNRNSNRKKNKKYWGAFWTYFYKSTWMHSHRYIIQHSESNIFSYYWKTKWRLGDATITISDAIYTTNFGAQTNKKSNVRTQDIRRNELFSRAKKQHDEIVWEDGVVQYTFKRDAEAMLKLCACQEENGTENFSNYWINNRNK